MVSLVITIDSTCYGSSLVLVGGNMIKFKESTPVEVVEHALNQYVEDIALYIIHGDSMRSWRGIDNILHKAGLRDACSIAEGNVPTSNERGKSLFSYLSSKYSDGRSLDQRLESAHNIVRNSKGIRVVND